MLILRCQRVLFSAYRTDQYPDPDGYMTSLGAVLEQYPDDVICYVTDPRTGIQRRSKWPPTISEIVEALDERCSELKRAERYRDWGVGMIEAPKEERPTREDLIAKYGKGWGLTGAPDPAAVPAKPQAPSWDDIAGHYSADPALMERLVTPTKDHPDER